MEAGDDATVAMVAELHAKLGNAHMRCGQLDLAATNYKAALRLAPHLTSCWCNLGNVQLQTGSAQDAIALYLQALKLNPAHWPSRTNLAQALMATKQYLVARALLTELAEERPQDGKIRHQLGKACFELDDIEAAIGHFQAAVAINAHDAESLYWIGGIKQKMGDIEAAQAAYVAAAQIQPLIRRSAVKSPADFRVLALYAPFAGNTPAEYLFKEAAYDTDTYALLDSSEPDAASLRRSRRRRQPDFRCRPGRRGAAVGRSPGGAARQACHQRPRQDPAHHARCGRRAVAGNTWLPHSANPAPCRRQRRLDSGAAGAAAVLLSRAGSGRRGRMAATISKRSAMSPNSQASSRSGRTATIT